MEIFIAFGILLTVLASVALGITAVTIAIMWVCAYQDGYMAGEDGKYWNTRSKLTAWMYDYGYGGYDRAADRKARRYLRNRSHLLGNH